MGVEGGELSLISEGRCLVVARQMRQSQQSKHSEAAAAAACNSVYKQHAEAQPDDANSHFLLSAVGQRV